MKRYSVKKGLEVALWLQERLSRQGSSSIAGLAEDIIANKKSLIPRRPPSSSTERQLSTPKAPLVARAGLHRTSLSSSSLLLHRSSYGYTKAFGWHRCYYTDSRGLQHFARRGFFNSKKWSTRQIVFVVMSATGFCAAIYFSHCEVVPYTFRSHFVLIPPEIETRLVESQFQALKEEWKPFLLPPFHPEAIRVRRIAKDIIRAVLEGLQIDEAHAPEVDHGGRVRTRKEEDIEFMTWQPDGGSPISAEWTNKDEALDDEWMDRSRKKGLTRKEKPYSEHLKNTKWEILIVDKDVVNAFALPGGKIVVFTGLLKRFPMDNEIATVLGHEVSHVVARHSAERMTRHLFVTLFQLLLLAFVYAPDLVRSMSVLFLELPFSRGQELEADHIGLLLMAAAGYDPRVSPYVYERLSEVTKTPEFLQYVTTHPSGKKRGQRLRQTGTMEEALRIYEQRTHGRVVGGFLDSY